MYQYKYIVVYELIEDIRMKYIQLLKEAVEKSSQKEVGEVLGVSQPQIHRWLKGSQLPSSKRVKAIAQLIGMSTDEILDEIANCDLGHSSEL